jgi:FkbH-like protein
MCIKRSLREYISSCRLERVSDYFSLERKIDGMYAKDEFTVDKVLNIAVLASSTINGLKETLKVVCGENNLFSQVYIGEYNQYAQEILNSESALYQSNPDLVILNVDLRAIAGTYFTMPYSTPKEERRKWVEETANLFINLAVEVSTKSTAKVLLHNFEIPFYSPLGLVENKEDYGFIESLEDLNRKLRDHFKTSNQVFVFDYDTFCSRLGKENLLDYKMYYMGDIKFKTQNFPQLAQEYARYIKALALGSKKCIVLDLDNTLWGGVVGESGVEGIHLGPTAEGRSFLEFQQYLLALFKRGIILAINSKNNEEEALKAIREHPHMVLKEEHFAAMRINWNDKVANMKSLAEEINIGLDSMVFFDDDHLNRGLVNEFIPEVTVVDMPANTSLYVDTLLKLNYFDTLSLTTEDLKKGSMYVEEKQRRELAHNTDLTQYLRMLNITLRIEHANKKNIPRIAQLTQKTNQFNLTTRRYTIEEIEAFSESENFQVITITLSDKFGDSGLTGLAIIDTNAPESWLIETFLLSCRILGRKAEDALLAHIIDTAKKEGAKSISGNFIPSENNIPAKDFYNNCGFKKIDTVGNIETWEFDLSNRFDFPDFINYDVL